MNLIKFEVKKLFTIKTIGFAGIVALLIYSLTMQHNIEFFTNGSIEGSYYTVANEILTDYGPYMDKNEFEDFKKETKTYEENAQMLIKNNKDLKGYGVTNLEEFERFREESDFLDEKISDLIMEIAFDEKKLLYDARNLVIENYNKSTDENEIIAEYMDISKKDLERIKEFRSREDSKAPIPYFFLRNTESLAIGMFGIIAFTVFLLISPIFIRDRSNKVNQLQHGARIGRKIFKSKLIAGFVGAGIITTLELLILGGLLSTTGAFKFWDCSVNSELMGGYIRAVDLTIGEYIIVIGIFGYIVAFAVAGISMFISTKANTYIALVMCNIIAVGSIFMLSFFGVDLFASTMESKYYQIGCWIIITIIGIIASIYILKNQRKLDID